MQRLFTLSDLYRNRVGLTYVRPLYDQIDWEGNLTVLLDRADVITNFRYETKGTTSLGKPDKIFLSNPNLLYALAPHQVQTGTARETFFLSHLNYLTHQQHFLPPEIRLPKQGDFVLLDKEERYLFEVGGSGKGNRQIGEGPNHFVVTDRKRSGGPGKVPLWLFGLLY